VRILAALLSVGALPAIVLGSAAGVASARSQALAQSPELWATVDICNAPHHPNTIGIRGSMPSDGHPHDTMYMRFLVQSLDPSTHKWSDLGKSVHLASRLTASGHTSLAGAEPRGYSTATCTLG
jgi:hypothetical protein